MKPIKGSAGIFLMVLATLGLLLCIGAVTGIWGVRNYVGHLADRVVRITGQNLISIDHRIDLIGSSLQETLCGIRSGISMAHRLEKNQKDVPFAAKAISSLLDDEVRERLDKVQELTNSIGATADTIDHAFGFLDSGPTEEGENEAVEGPLVTRIQWISEALLQTSALVDQIRKTTVELNAHPNLASELVPKLLIQMSQFDDRIGKVRDRLSSFEQSIRKINNRVQCWKDQIPRWVTTGTLLVSLLLIWMGAGQFTLFICGWRICR